MKKNKDVKSDKKVPKERKAKINDILSINYFNDEMKLEIGIDEVGRGPLFGPVYTAAVILPKSNFKFELLKDSKRFHSFKKIKEVSDYIKENCIAYSIQYSDEKIIDQSNIRIATFKSMHNAIKEIIESNASSLECYYLLVDGNDFITYTHINHNSELIGIDNYCIEGGDNKYCSIAAASILAKVARDEYIEDLCKKYPKLDEYYSISKNKGYGTKLHIKGIEEFGISKWHRKSYGLCKVTHENNDF